MLTASTFGEPVKVSEKTAWIGDQVDLECGDSGLNNADRVWKKGGLTLAMGTFDLVTGDRINPVNNSVVLRISDVKVEDQGQYTCTTRSVPTFTRSIQLRVTEALCMTPNNPVNGGYSRETPNNDPRSFKMGDIIRYYCDPGFEVLGEALQVCSGALKGWSSEEPYCGPKYVAQLKRQLDTLKDKMRNIDNLMTTTNTTLTSFEILISGIEFVKKQMRKDGKLATGSVKDGCLVSTITWYVKNIQEEIAKSKGHESYKVRTNEFYTNIPGYKVQLVLYPNNKNSGYLGVYMYLVNGAFDDIMPWPFGLRYEISTDTCNGSRIASKEVNPSTTTVCPKAFLKPPANKNACGDADYMKIDDLLANKDKYLTGGSLKIRITFWLNN